MPKYLKPNIHTLTLWWMHRGQLGSQHPTQGYSDMQIGGAKDHHCTNFLIIPDLDPCGHRWEPPWRCQSRAPCRQRWPTADSSGRRTQSPTRCLSAPRPDPRLPWHLPSASHWSKQQRDTSRYSAMPAHICDHFTKKYFTEIFSFFFKPLFCMNSGPGMQLMTAGMPPAQEDVAFGLLNSSGQAARWTSVPVHATEWRWKLFFWRSKYNLEGAEARAGTVVSEILSESIPWLYLWYTEKYIYDIYIYISHTHTHTRNNKKCWCGLF